MSRRLQVAAAAAALVSCLGLSASAAPFVYPPPVGERFPVPAPPGVTAASWLLYDDNLGMVVAARNADEVRSIASVTKIMTGLLAVERGSMSDPVTISERAADTGEKEIELVAGETVTLEALFKALMIHSANDAATAIAEHIGGSVEGFVEMMNERAAELGLESTHFSNPHGLDADRHHSSARDLLELTRVAMSHPEFADVVRAKVLLFPPAPDGTARVGTTTNLMLHTYPGMIGVKTGFTAQALLTFTAAAERDGHRLYLVVLGSDGQRAHFSDAALLLDYGFEYLGFYKEAAVGGGYQARMERTGVDPLLGQARMETYLHLAAQGLLTGGSSVAVEDDRPQPEPVTEVIRRPVSGPANLAEAIAFWIALVAGQR